MLFHTMVGSNDIERSRRFYDAVLATIGTGSAMENVAGSGHTRLMYGKGGAPYFIITQPIDGTSATVANGGTVAFNCSSPEQVRQFHDTAVAQGGTSVEDGPGPRESSMGTMHLAYVRDPDGNKLCAIHIPG